MGECGAVAGLHAPFTVRGANPHGADTRLGGMVCAIAITGASMLPLSSDTPTDQVAPAGGSFLVGQDTSGQWLTIETAHRGGGLFKCRADAVHFAAFESGHRPDCIRFLPVPLRMAF